MKKRISFYLLTALLVFSFPGCENPTNSDLSGKDDNSQNEQDTPNSEKPSNPENPSGSTGLTETVLPALPAVSTVYSFALGIDDTDGTLKLGFMFNGDEYKTELSETLQGGFVGGDDNVFSLYDLNTKNGTWMPTGGRTTTQYYKYSELVYNRGDSYYTTNFDGFGALISAIKNGGDGTYALTAQYADKRSHDIAFLNNTFYTAVIGKNSWGAGENGLALSSVPLDKFTPGCYPSPWTPKVIIDPATDGSLTYPVLITAGKYLAMSYQKDGKLHIRITDDPENLKGPEDFTLIGTFDAAAQDSVLAWDGTHLYAAYLNSSSSLTVRKASLSEPSSVKWEDVSCGFSGSAEDFDLAILPESVAMAVRSGRTVRIYDDLTTESDFTKSIDGDIDLEADQAGNLVLTVCGKDKILRSFLYR